MSKRSGGAVHEATTTLEPTYDNVAVVKDDADQVSAGGIVLIQTAKHKSMKGVILAVGPGKEVDGKFVPNPRRPGEHVVWGAFSGHTIDHEGVSFVLLPATEILAVIP